MLAMMRLAACVFIVFNLISITADSRKGGKTHTPLAPKSIVGARALLFSESHVGRKKEHRLYPKLEVVSAGKGLHAALTRHGTIVHNDSLLQCHFNERGQAPATNYRFVDRLHGP